MQNIFCLISLFFFLACAYFSSHNRKEVRFLPILLLLVIELVLGFVMLNTTAGNTAILWLSEGFNKILEAAATGVDFVFGGIANKGSSPFYLSVLMPIIFISALIGILQHIKVLPFLIKGIGFIFNKISRRGELESFQAIASIILGQSEVFISVKNTLPKMSERRLYTLCAFAMSTVSMSIVGSYMKLIEPTYVFTGIILNLFGGFIITSLINPYDPNEEETLLEVAPDKKQTFFEVMGEYIMDGFKVATTVGAMLIGFVALISLINMLFAGIFGISFQTMLGYLFSPLAFLMGVPWSQAIAAGSVMATKLVSNEFVAMSMLHEGTVHLGARATAVTSVFLVSFANFSSIGILSGAVGGLNEAQGKRVAGFGLKLLWGATLVSCLSATIVGILFH